MDLVIKLKTLIKFNKNKKIKIKNKKIYKMIFTRFKDLEILV